MTRALLVAGPPHDVALWDDVQARLSSSLECLALALLSDESVASTVDDQAEWLARRLLAAGPSPVLIAHGLALPAAVRAAAVVPQARVVLCNGPVRRLDPVTRLLAAVAHPPAALAHSIFQPPVVLRWLYSSAGLRRAVRNPYVMDRDTVVAICGPTFASRGRRQAVAEYVADLPQAVRSTPTLGNPCLALWGDEDRLYPPAEVDDLRLLAPQLQQVAVPGGRQLHPVERPWLVADAILAWLGQR